MCAKLKEETFLYLHFLSEKIKYVIFQYAKFHLLSTRIKLNVLLSKVKINTTSVLQ